MFRIIGLLCLFWMATASAIAQDTEPYYLISVDVQKSGEQFIIDRAFAGNNAFIACDVYKKSQAFTNLTDWTFTLFYARDQYSTSGVSVAQSSTSGSRIYFLGATNVYSQPFNDYWVSVIGTDTGGLTKTFGTGRMIVDYDPALDSPSPVSELTPWNWNLYGPFSGLWPFYSYDTSTLQIVSSATGLVFRLNPSAISETDPVFVAWLGTNTLANPTGIYTKVESNNRFATNDQSYTKAESDGRHAAVTNGHMEGSVDINGIGFTAGSAITGAVSIGFMGKSFDFENWQASVTDTVQDLSAQYLGGHDAAYFASTNALALLSLSLTGTSAKAEAAFGWGNHATNGYIRAALTNDFLFNGAQVAQFINTNRPGVGIPYVRISKPSIYHPVIELYEGAYGTTVRVGVANGRLSEVESDGGGGIAYWNDNTNGLASAGLAATNFALAIGAGSSNSFVKKSGDTMTGALVAPTISVGFTNHPLGYSGSLLFEYSTGVGALDYGAGELRIDGENVLRNNSSTAVNAGGVYDFLNDTFFRQSSTFNSIIVTGLFVATGVATSGQWNASVAGIYDLALAVGAGATNFALSIGAGATNAANGAGLAATNADLRAVAAQEHASNINFYVWSNTVNAGGQILTNVKHLVFAEAAPSFVANSIGTYGGYLRRFLTTNTYATIFDTANATSFGLQSVASFNATITNYWRIVATAPTGATSVGTRGDMNVSGTNGYAYDGTRWHRWNTTTNWP